MKKYQVEYASNRGVMPILTKAQAEQIAEAEIYVADAKIMAVINNPKLTPKQMQSLMLIACNHPLAAVDFYDLSAEGIAKMKAETYDMVQKKAKSFLKQNYKKHLKGR